MAKIMNGDITLAALCHCQRASKVISPFIIFAVFDVSFHRYNSQINYRFVTFIFTVLLPRFKYRQLLYQKVCITTVVRVTVNFHPSICLLVSFEMADGRRQGRVNVSKLVSYLCLTLTISNGYRSLIYPCITIIIGEHRRLTQSTQQICRPTI